MSGDGTGSTDWKPTEMRRGEQVLGTKKEREPSCPKRLKRR
jgi:hypothetical protein